MSERCSSCGWTGLAPPACAGCGASGYELRPPGGTITAGTKVFCIHCCPELWCLACIDATGGVCALHQDPAYREVAGAPAAPRWGVNRWQCGVQRVERFFRTVPAPVCEWPVRDTQISAPLETFVVTLRCHLDEGHGDVHCAFLPDEAGENAGKLFPWVE